MTSLVEPEAGPRPPRSPCAGRPLLVVVVVLAIAALALGGAWWFRATETNPAADWPESTAVPTPSAPAEERPAEGSRQRSVAPLPPISGTTVDAVAAGWAKLWDTPPKVSTRGYDTKATLPGTGYPTRFGVLASSVDGGTEVATLFCIISNPRLIKNRQLIQAVVDSCLAPALRSGEKAALLAWLIEQDYSGNVYDIRKFPRFNAELVSAGDKFSGDTFSVRLLSKGRPVPGAPPTTGTGADE